MTTPDPSEIMTEADALKSLEKDFGNDVTIIDMMKRRHRTRPPNLSYLGYNNPTSYDQGFAYSEEMIEALGCGKKQEGMLDKATANKGCSMDGGPPWASLPVSLHEPIISLYGTDFQKGNAVKPLEDGREPISAVEVMRKRQKEIKEARERRSADAFDVSKFDKKVPKSVSVTPGPGGSMKHFDCQGVTRRAPSVPIKDQIAAIKIYKSGEKPEAIPDINNPLLGGESLFLAEPKYQFPANYDKYKDDPKKVPHPSGKQVPVVMSFQGQKFLSRYPHDRSKLKHHILEEKRWAEGKNLLTTNGWEAATSAAGNDKRLSNNEFATTLSKEDQAEVERKLEEYNAARHEAKAKRMEREQELRQAAANEEIQKRKRREARSTYSTHTSLFGDEEENSEVSGSQPHSLNSFKRGQSPPSISPFPAVGPNTKSSAAIEDEESAKTKDKPYQYSKTENFAPVPMYRPELPAQSIPTTKRLEMVPGSKNPPVAPPWGRQTELDDKWQKVRVYSTRTKKGSYQPLQKIEVDRELRIVRDNGLCKRDKKSLLKSMDPKQIQYIKNLPNNALSAVAHVKSMKPVAKIAPATLK